MHDSTAPPQAPGPRRPFSGDDLYGEVAVANPPADLVERVRALVDPATAIETIHWDRNYLYAAEVDLGDGPTEVVVKQCRNLGFRRRHERRLRGSKAQRSWTAAFALLEAGIPTPIPLLVAESRNPEGPSFFVTRRLTDATEIRHFFRTLESGPSDAWPYSASTEEVLGALGRLARRLHDQGIWYRDLSLGNVLVCSGEDGLELFLVDCNRARVGKRLGTLRRCRDICRFPIVRREHREAYLRAYWGELPPRHSPRWWFYTASVRAYLLKHKIKNRLRSLGRSRSTASGGRHHAHIPPAERGASARDRIVWDHLSDQPHQHAGKLQKIAIRITDAGAHINDAARIAAALPRVWRRYRRLGRGLHSGPVAFTGIGVGVQPWLEDPEAQIRTLTDLGVGHVLLRLQPWAEEHDAEERLAQELADRGVNLSFALPQNRELVRDPERWRSAIEELGERFSPFGSDFQVGQAPNRSKWGIWNRDEYVEIASAAMEILRRHPGVRVLGPSVIDFEHHMTVALVNRRAPGYHFDAVSSLLYVDRRGAPENPQLGFDTIGKVTLLRAVAETGLSCAGETWVTEVNWPLWEGPHAPAGRKVAVDEETQADYLVRYFLLSLGTGLLERVYWWRLIARGYGLATPSGDDSLRRRPSFEALRVLIRELEGASFLGPLTAPTGAYLYRFRRNDDEVIVGWTVTGRAEVDLPRPIRDGLDRNGRPVSAAGVRRVELHPSPRYFRLGD